MRIIKVIGREIYDSRGLPTIECELVLQDNTHVRASVPSGLSRGSHEAIELRDGGLHLMGKGVSNAIKNLEEIIAPLLIGNEPDVVEMDSQILQLDGTEDKSHLGANAILAASLAVCRAQAVIEGIELYELLAHLCGFDLVTLPFGMFNVINGGIHADNNLQIQEFMVMPIGVSSFRASMELACIYFHTLKKILQQHGQSTAVGDEGGFVPQFDNELEALDCLMETIECVQQKHDGSVMIALDVAASQFYNQETETYNWHGRQVYADDLISWYKQLVDQYPIYAIEDGLSEYDWNGWHKLSHALGSRLQLVGDDIFVTNYYRILEGLQDNIANTILIKPNQVGTVTETLQAIKLCKKYDRNIIISHRSGETNDSFIADLAVGTASGQIKAGGFSRGERMAKYNRLLRIEDGLIGVD